MMKCLKKLLILLLSICVSFDVSAQKAEKRMVAVYITGSNVVNTYKKVIGAKLVSAITESEEYVAVERTADFLAALSAENNYQASGDVRDSQIAKLGQKFGVHYVAVADISKILDEIFIASRLIDVETGLVKCAYDANGPIENMSQLVNLSIKVATGLMKGISDLPDSSTGDITEEPAAVFLALCAIDKDGKIKYVTTEQWQKMSESAKRSYTKKGVCMAKNDLVFLVSMCDVGSGDWSYACHNNAPDRRQLELINMYLKPLNIALRIFGGCPLGEGEYYWSSTEYGSSSAWTVFTTGNTFHNLSTNTFRVRPVIPWLLVHHPK